MRTAGLFLLAALVAPFAAPQTLEIETASGTELEQRGVEQLRRILETWELERWTFVDRVRIESGVIPHSHPVLTLSTRYVDQDEAQLATYVHENFHWFVMEHQGALAAAIEEHRVLYPDAPGREGGGARDRESSYLHLVVCDLEFRAMIELLGETWAREVIAGWTHYPWVYEKVLADPRVHEINARHGLVPPS